MTPDFRVPGAEKSEDGRERSSEEPDAADQDTEEPTEKESGDWEETKKRPGTTGVLMDAEHAEDQERSEDTLKSCHVPGGAWLNKCIEETNQRIVTSQEGSWGRKDRREITD
ncbi:hypothetical protein NDU88_005674 [Pleurodeles waltl]|uniref:Uncharacterized protein n=1 Tax=Pleurodeles waltl TaxID=8319 RepID=A0AAV7SMJ4_PLEWA|nr:hypothetical protein NDU88_005674 [Pleurodeles waltl]